MTHKSAGAQKAASVSSRTMQGRKGRKHYNARAQRPRACEQGRKAASTSNARAQRPRAGYRRTVQGCRGREHLQCRGAGAANTYKHRRAECVSPRQGPCMKQSRARERCGASELSKGVPASEHRSAECQHKSCGAEWSIGASERRAAQRSGVEDQSLGAEDCAAEHRSIGAEGCAVERSGASERRVAQWSIGAEGCAAEHRSIGAEGCAVEHRSIDAEGCAVERSIGAEVCAAGRSGASERRAAQRSGVEHRSIGAEELPHHGADPREDRSIGAQDFSS